MKKLNIVFLSLLFPGLISSFSAPLSKAQKQKITQIHVPAETVRPHAYAKPAVMSNGTAGAIGLASGLTGGLIGAVVATAVVAGVEAGHAKSNKDLFSMIEANTPKNLGDIVAQKLTDRLKTDPFYGSRVSAEALAPSQVKVEITRYTLEKTGANHSPVIFANVGLYLEGKKIRSLIKMVDGCNGHVTFGAPKRAVLSAPTETYAADPRLLLQHYEIVADYLAEDISKDLNMMAGADGKSA